MLLIFTLRRKKRKVGNIPEWIRLDRTTLLRTLVYTYAGTEHESQDLRTRTRTHHALTADAQTDCDSRRYQWCSGRVEGVRLSAVVCRAHSFLDRRSISKWSARDKMWSWTHILVRTCTPNEPLRSLQTLNTTDTKFSPFIWLCWFLEVGFD